jgi:serine/threonine protein kinase
MGEVYRAKDTRLDRTVAIKVLPSHLSDDPQLKQRMEREAKAISALQHAISARSTTSAPRTAPTTW